MPVFLLLVLVFVIWFTYERKKSSLSSDKSSKSFWERERSASYVPRQSTADVPFITFPAELVPVGHTEEPLAGYCRELTELSALRIADLSVYSNTDLKLKYGTGNFKALSQADENFSRLRTAITGCCSELISLGARDEAFRLLEYAYTNGIHSSAILIPYAEMLSEHGEQATVARILEEELSDPSCPQSVADRLRIIHNNTMNN